MDHRRLSCTILKSLSAPLERDLERLQKLVNISKQNNRDHRQLHTLYFARNSSRQRFELTDYRVIRILALSKIFLKTMLC